MRPGLEAHEIKFVGIAQVLTLNIVFEFENQTHMLKTTVYRVLTLVYVC